ncbi:hypothetical protein DFP72DRAFT_1053502 [Ephemerocybe angulata]|uniref:Uncharacterized protein n=1 Tax=Ephemerocybe angulata TaxID=980116 RepID=A0A8H6HC40_9AGAR|nr:hypothetical protein DFP72DRAFT_1053502 [Tulosesus angulatus]
MASDFAACSDGPLPTSVSIGKQVRRQHIMHVVREMVGPDNKPKKNNRASLPFSATERLPRGSPTAPYQMSHETNAECRINLLTWLAENQRDPAFKGFYRKLKTHLYYRLAGLPYDGDEAELSDEQLQKVVIVNDSIYRHKVIRINYTTYDLRREQDSLNPRTHADIMMLAHDDDDEHAEGVLAHPYWYARIIGVLHVRVVWLGGDTFEGARPQDVDLLWIRWYGRANSVSNPPGWKGKRLYRVGFVDEKKDQSPAFGFIDPSKVIRGVHLIPMFHRRKSSNGLHNSIARPESDGNLDWNYFNINMFVDRDMFMRFRGGGVGHKHTRDATDFFLNDRDPLDIIRREDPLSESQDPNDDAELADFRAVYAKNFPEMAPALAADVEGNDIDPDTIEYDDATDEEDIELGDEDEGEEEMEEDAEDDVLGAEDGEDDEDEIEQSGFSMY